MMRAAVTASVAVAIRLPEVEVAVLAVLDERGIQAGQTVPFVEIEVAMDGRGYSVRWVRRAVDSLVRKGSLRLAGPSTVQRLDLAPTQGKRGKRGKRYRTSGKNRASNF